MFGWLGARPRRAVLALCAVAGTATGMVACAGDEVLGPIDTAACTRGALDVRQETESAVTGRDCSLWSDRLYDVTYAETWTLAMQPRTGYVIRLIPLERTPGVFPFAGSLRVYERNAHGDAQIATESLLYGGRNQELIMTTDAARKVALRVEADSPADTGSYRIEVSTCPVLRMPIDSIIERVSTVNGCLSKGNFLGPNSRLTFLDFTVESLAEMSVQYERTAGTGSLRGAVNGVDLDFANLLDWSGNWRAPAPGTEYAFLLSPDRIGRYTLSVRTHADSAAIFAAAATTEPLLQSVRQP